MKKLLVMFMAMLMFVGVVGSAIPAYAEGNAVGEEVITEEILVEESEADEIDNPRVKDLEGYGQLLKLRATAKVIKAQIRADRVALKMLARVAKRTHNEEALAALEEGKAVLKQLREERRGLLETQKNNWLEIKEAREANDEEKMQDIMSNQILPTRQALNDSLKEIQNAQNDLIKELKDCLQGPAEVI